MDVRNWLKHQLPYWLTCAISRAINPPFLSDLHRSERLVEYAWVLAHLGKYHPPGQRIADVGYAGSYLAEAFCQFGPVVGIDPLKTPQITHPRFQASWPFRLSDLTPAPYTGICISVLEHLPREEALEIIDELCQLPQALITVPVAPLATKFRGYTPFTLSEIWDWADEASFEVFRREPEGWWLKIDGAYLGAPEGTLTILNRLVEHLPESTEHRVNAVACVRLRNPAVEWPPAAVDAGVLDSASPPPEDARGGSRD